VNPDVEDALKPDLMRLVEGQRKFRRTCVRGLNLLSLLKSGENPGKLHHLFLRPDYKQDTILSKVPVDELNHKLGNSPLTTTDSPAIRTSLLSAEIRVFPWPSLTLKDELTTPNLFLPMKIMKKNALE